MVEVVGKKSTQKAKEEEQRKTEEEKNFIVFPVPGGQIAVVQCGDEKAAARAYAAAAGHTGKLVVVEADYTEVYSASHRIELKQEQVQGLIADFSDDTGETEG
jgi:hypothetical protein